MGSDSDGGDDFESMCGDSQCDSYHSSDEDAPQGMDIDQEG
jgi:hypothetical protein